MSSTLLKLFLAALMSSSLMLMVGCSTPRTKPASVTDRSGGSTEPAPPGYYRVKKGDTLARIALDHGQAPRDVVQWNKTANPSFNPNVIEVGDLIMVKAPAGTKPAKVAEKKPAADKADSVASTPESAKNEVVAEPGIRLSWPAKGKVTGEFSETNKGIDIAGKVGEPVLAASDGKVVYAGNSLRGYGNLVIVKHDNTYLTAYAHNSKLLVKEGDAVRKGQKIAEMGDTDTTAAKLHFELRVNGKPVNPTPYLQ
ncbi:MULTISPECIES: peptidoglycan DD-metalloendopeptidase family protein [unclassified Polynucleobacter]|uniref:peptidoglycan DD-metalloendopeptidase family protein n=1 Tax=unclassified Polynucleobacter TaxID=2640945 RepID=UPI001BFED589|nr:MULTISPECIES: peptidoglycan DD-metalloendopeptidase family protein [unclassified Polynucleobacter]MBU3638947.1 peptidoglycan DD-metalloendopeptidase family protein [Polynucleobacter sp. AP-RePozz3-80-G7]QWD82292.1 peptidoglycan DD-metalloendopeptidase family protein [Polynucleobacter sp. MWH-S4W17]